MSWPKRLAEEDYIAIIGEAETHLREHLPTGVPSMASLRVMLQMLRIETEAKKASQKPEMSRLEIREELCRKLIACAESGDKQAKKHAKLDLQVLAILILEDIIAGRGDAAASGSLLRCVRDILERLLPNDEERRRERKVQIATAVDMVLQKWPGIMATRNRESRSETPPELACSLVTKALAKVDPMSDINVQKIWETYGVCRRPDS